MNINILSIYLYIIIYNYQISNKKRKEIILLFLIALVNGWF